MHALRRLLVQPSLQSASLERFFQTSSCFNMPIKENDKLPSVDLFEGSPEGKVNSGDLLSKGKVVLFGVPGAFTPTCSNDHVPGFIDAVDKLKAKGADTIACVSVNDPFVMAAWGKSLDPKGKIRFLADTTASFTKAIDLAFDLTVPLGNIRSKRFALVADNGVVKGINVEPDGAGLSCSAAADVLKML